MKILQVYAFFVLPVIILGMAGAAYWWIGRASRRLR
ncbi:hypothetical protein J2S22_005809 [Rhodoplanes tepidamans]|nr:hypothetical protein [Rhodoplanes tepidamans]